MPQIKGDSGIVKEPRVLAGFLAGFTAVWRRLRANRRLDPAEPF
jgi:hypothetical protein